MDIYHNHFNYYQYKRNINKKNKFSFTIIFLLIILLIGLCIFLAPTAKNYNTFYYVELDKFQTYKQANNLVNQIENLNTSCYVYFDNSYHVIVSFHSNKKDAENVKENLVSTYQNANVFSLEFNKFNNLKNLTSKQNSGIKNFIETTKKVIYKLENLLIDFEKTNISFARLSIELNNEFEQINSSHNKLIENFKTNSKFNICKEYSLNILDSFSNLLSLDEHKATQTLRYNIIDISVNLTKFCSYI